MHMIDCCENKLFKKIVFKAASKRSFKEANFNFIFSIFLHLKLNIEKLNLMLNNNVNFLWIGFDEQLVNMKWHGIKKKI